MSTKTLNVTWDDHLQNLSGLFQDLYENKKLCDVTLYCSGGTLLKAHKIVLSACSPYFSKIFQEIDIKHPVIILKGVTYDEMHQLLEFMYKGSINILEQDLACLIQAGSYLEIKGMDAKNIPNNIKTNLKRTACDAHELEHQESPKKLKDANHQEIAKIAEHVSRESSPASTSRRETRFKGQKRVDVKFRSSLGSLSPVTVTKKKDADEEFTEDADKHQKNDKNKGKTTKKVFSVKHVTGDSKNSFNKNKSQIEKKSTTTQPEQVERAEKLEKTEKTEKVEKAEKTEKVEKEKVEKVDKAEKVKDDLKVDETKVENSENDGVSNLVIKDVYSTNELNKIAENSDKEQIDENEDDDDNYSELDDENLVFPDVSFKETDGEIVTQSDDEAIQNTDASEHLNVSYMECSYCSMTFKNDNDLFCHQKVHTETKPFKCDFCDTFFQRSSHLARHRRKHIGDRPYECKTCGKAFSRSDKLRTHCRQAHDDDYKPPPHLKKKYEFVEFTGDMLEKKGRGRPRKFPMRDPPRPPIDGQKRGRGRPRKMSCPAPGEPVENYDITNLPFGDFSYLTEAITMQAQQQAAETYHDISIIPVSTSSTSAIQNDKPESDQQQIQQQQIQQQQPQHHQQQQQQQQHQQHQDKEQIKSNDLISNIRQIGECTIQPVTK